jgi:hypothetical protein
VILALGEGSAKVLKAKAEPVVYRTAVMKPEEEKVGK